MKCDGGSGQLAGSRAGNERRSLWPFLSTQPRLTATGRQGREALSCARVRDARSSLCHKHLPALSRSIEAVRGRRAATAFGRTGRRGRYRAGPARVPVSRGERLSGAPAPSRDQVAKEKTDGRNRRRARATRRRGSSPSRGEFTRLAKSGNSGNLVPGQVTLKDGKIEYNIAARDSSSRAAASPRAINIAAQFKAVCDGDLDRVQRMSLGGFVNPTPDLAAEGHQRRLRLHPRQGQDSRAGPAGFAAAGGGGIGNSGRTPERRPRAPSLRRPA